MVRSPLYPLRRGPFRADEIREGDPYELSNGHVIVCLPTGGRGADATVIGAAVLRSDPDVESAGADAGFSPAPDTLRAPDLAVGNVPSAPGWVKGVPPLAVEYADTGQDERDLGVKIRELLDAGTRLVWVVRLTGPRRVEVHEAGREMRIARPGAELEAPGILRNAVPVEALYDWRVAEDVTLRNLLQRKGYEGLDALRSEGEVRALRVSILEVLETRGLEVDALVRAAVAACSDLETLRRWHRAAVTARNSAAVVTPPRKRRPARTTPARS